MKEVAGIRELSLNEVEAVVGGDGWCQTICDTVYGALICSDATLQQGCYREVHQMCHTVCY